LAAGVGVVGIFGLVAGLDVGAALLTGATVLAFGADLALFFPDDGFLETAIGAGSLPGG
jgi:hypothetical protein